MPNEALRILPTLALTPWQPLATVRLIAGKLFGGSARESFPLPEVLQPTGITGLQFLQMLENPLLGRDIPRLVQTGSLAILAKEGLRIRESIVDDLLALVPKGLDIDRARFTARLALPTGPFQLAKAVGFKLPFPPKPITLKLSGHGIDRPEPKEEPMANGFGSFLSGIGGAITKGFSSAISTAIPALTQVGVSQLLPRPTLTAGIFPQPVARTGGPGSVTMITQKPSMVPAMAGGGALAGGRVALGAARQVIAALVARAAQAMGVKRMSGRQIKQMLRTFGVTAAATATGLTVSELLFIEVFHKSPRMNVANVHALRRSMRRIEGFHRLCTKADVLRRSRRRGGPRRRRANGTPTIIAQN